jgi:hypothetical protein
MHTKASKWHRHRNIQRASTITTQLLTIMRPPITIIRRSTITAVGEHEEAKKHAAAAKEHSELAHKHTTDAHTHSHK